MWGEKFARRDLRVMIFALTGGGRRKGLGRKESTRVSFVLLFLLEFLTTLRKQCVWEKFAGTYIPVYTYWYLLLFVQEGKKKGEREDSKGKSVILFIIV